MPDARPTKSSFLKNNLLRLKLTFNSLKDKLNNFKKLSFNNLRRAGFVALCTILGTFLLIVLAAKGPELHDTFIRGKVGSRVYTIKAELTGGGGTGFQVKAPSGSNYILTNAHVCNYIEKVDSPDNKQTVLVVNDDGGWVRRRIVAVSDQTDLCLIEGMPGMSGLSLGHEPSTGEHMTVAGHPHLRPITLSAGEVIGSEDVPVIDHVISVKGNPLATLMFMGQIDPNAKCDLPKDNVQIINIPKEAGGGEIQICIEVTKDAYMTSIVIYGGNSGSPMVDFWGNVCGVAFASSDEDNYAEVVSLSDIETFMANY